MLNYVYFFSFFSHKYSNSQTEKNSLQNSNNLAAVSCSSVVPRLDGVKMGLGLIGKLGRAWVSAWVGA